ncbi:MAG: hypothetical protein NTV57_09395 [Cyanobacteria bacterium]|nr:hypothetical protein [Cyanobacteriota bacterium]
MKSPSPQGQRSWSLLPPLLLLLALGDLRIDLQLLLDHFTVTTLVTAIRSHPLAVVVLLAQPSLWRRYGKRQRQVGDISARPSDP